jgi:hypothetical protein
MKKAKITIIDEDGRGLMFEGELSCERFKCRNAEGSSFVVSNLHGGATELCTGDVIITLEGRLLSLPRCG